MNVDLSTIGVNTYTFTSTLNDGLQDDFGNDDGPYEIEEVVSARTGTVTVCAYTNQDDTFETTDDNDELVTVSDLIYVQEIGADQILVPIVWPTSDVSDCATNNVAATSDGLW